MPRAAAAAADQTADDNAEKTPATRSKKRTKTAAKKKTTTKSSSAKKKKARHALSAQRASRAAPSARTAAEDENRDPDTVEPKAGAIAEPVPPDAKSVTREFESPAPLEPPPKLEPAASLDAPPGTARALNLEGSPSMVSPPSAHGHRTTHAALETSGYADTDHVSVLSPTLSAGIADEVSGWSVNGHYTVDVVSAASVDIVSTASPHWVEVRHAGGASASMAFEPATVGASAVVSREPDYLSITGGATLSVDLLDKNLTPYLALSREEDSIGRTDLPHEYWHSKHVTNLQLGLTAVLSRSTIGSIQWDGGFERGYLAKPYRYVPLFAPGQGASIGAGASIDEVNRLRLSQRPSEQVPNSRDRYALSAHLAHRGDASTLRLDERLYTDDWGLLAATSEVRYILDLSRRLELWPHLRHHIQSAVSFWRRAYEAIPGPDGSLGVPVFRAGNRELGPLQTIIIGAGARMKLTEAPATEWDLVLEIDVGHTSFTDDLFISDRNMGYSTLAIEATF